MKTKKSFRIEKISWDAEAYQKMAQEHGSIFHDPNWLKIFQDGIQLYGIFKHEEMVGCFYLYKTRMWGLSYLKKPMATPDNGLIIANEYEKRYKELSFKKQLHQSISEFLSKNSKSIINFTIPAGAEDLQPYLWNSFKTSPVYTYNLDLSEPKQKFKENCNPKLLSDIQKAKKDGIEIEKVKDFSVVKELVNNSFKRQNKQLPQKYLSGILEKFANDKNAFAFVAKKEDKAIATSFCIHDKATSFYILGGYDHENKHRGAGPATLMACINHSQDLRLSTFDFEGSMIPAIESYFRQFGGVLTPRFVVHRAPLLVEFALKLFKRSIY